MSNYDEQYYYRDITDRVTEPFKNMKVGDYFISKCSYGVIIGRITELCQRVSGRVEFDMLYHSYKNDDIYKLYDGKQARLYNYTLPYKKAIKIPKKDIEDIIMVAQI